MLMRKLFLLSLPVLIIVMPLEPTAARLGRQQDQRLSAEKAYEEAKKLSEQATTESLRASIEKFKQAGDAFRAAGDSDRAMSMLLFIAHTYYDLNEKQKTIEYAGQILSTLRSQGSTPLRSYTQAWALSLMAASYFDLNQLTEALENYQQEVALWKSIQDKKQLALAWSNVALVYDSMGDKNKALDAYNNSISLANDFDDSAVKARLFGNYGTLLVEVGESQVAKDWLQLAANIHKRLGNEKAANRLLKLLQPNLIVQLGHSSDIRTINFSPDGRYIATAGQDNTARLWETATGREIRRFEGHIAVILSVAFTPDGHNILTGGLDGTVRLWNLETGEEIRQYTAERAEVASVAVSPDGHVVAAGIGQNVRLWDFSSGHELNHVDTGTRVNSVVFSPDGKFIAIGDGASLDPARIKAWLIQKTGKAIISDDEVAKEIASESGAIKNEVVVLETTSLREIWKFKSPNSAVDAVAFSNDGRFVLSASSDTRPNGENVARLFDSTTGRELKQFTHQNRVTGKEPLMGVAFSPDSRLALTVGVESVRLWDIDTGTELRQIRRAGDMFFTAAFSKDGLIATAQNRSASLYEAASGKALRNLEGYSFQTMAMAISPDGLKIATGHFQLKRTNRIEPSGTVCLWDLSVGNEVQRFNGHESAIESLAFSSDGKFLLSGSGDTTARLWTIETGAQVGRFESTNTNLLSFSAVSAVALSHDGRLALTGNGDVTGSVPSYAALWDVASGRELQRFSHQNEINSVAFSPNDRLVLTGSGGSVFTKQGALEQTEEVSILFDRDSGHEIRRFAGNHAIFSGDGRYVLTVGADQKVHFWVTDSGQEVRTFSGHSGSIDAMAVSGDDRFLVTGSDDGTARLWDVSNGNVLRVFPVSEGAVEAVAVTPDGKFIFTLSGDSVRVWSRDKGEEVCRLISFRDGTWVTVDSVGRFDTNNLEQIPGLHWMIRDEPMKPLPIEIFMRDYYEPKLLSRLLKCTPDNTCDKEFKSVRNLTFLNRTQPAVRIADVNRIANSDTVNVTVELGNATSERQRDSNNRPLQSGVYDVRLFRDGQIVGTWPRDAAQKLLQVETDSVKAATKPNQQTAIEKDLEEWRRASEVRPDSNVRIDRKTGKMTLSFRVRVPNGRDLSQVEFTAYAFNEDRVKSETATWTWPENQMAALSKAQAVKRRAYIVSIGVNASRVDKWKLNYAANDARLINGVVAEQFRQTGEYEVVPVLLVADDEMHDGKTLQVRDATKEKIRAVIDLLAGKPVSEELRKRIPNYQELKQASPDDLVLLSFSSHGYADQSGEFFMLPYDVRNATSGDQRLPDLQSCISSDELTLWLRDVDAGEMVMIVDACHAAAAVEGSGFKPGPMGSRGLGQLAYDKGMRILTATQAADAAIEAGGNISQGLLSYALVRDGIEQEKADFKPVDKQITLREWLDYGVVDVPELYKQIATGKLKMVGKGSEEIDKPNAPSYQQHPSLFDFARKRADVTLTRVAHRN